MKDISKERGKSQINRLNYTAYLYLVIHLDIISMQESCLLNSSLFIPF